MALGLLHQMLAYPFQSMALCLACMICFHTAALLLEGHACHMLCDDFKTAASYAYPFQSTALRLARISCFHTVALISEDHLCRVLCTCDDFKTAASCCPTFLMMWERRCRFKGSHHEIELQLPGLQQSL